MVDIIAASLGLIVLSPVVAVVAVLIRLETPGSPIYSHLRVGKGERTFRCFKLRSMYSGTSSVPTHLASAASVTRIGGFIRRTKLDELPQLWNVLVGEMSLVGPRPCLPTQAELIAERRAQGVFALRPGITGLAQIQGIDMSDPVRLAAKDAEYGRAQSLALDFRILVATVLGRGSGDRVRS